MSYTHQRLGCDALSYSLLAGCVERLDILREVHRYQDNPILTKRPFRLCLQTQAAVRQQPRLEDRALLQ